MDPIVYRRADSEVTKTLYVPVEVRASSYNEETHEVDWMLRGPGVDAYGTTFDSRGATLVRAAPFIDHHMPMCDATIMRIMGVVRRAWPEEGGLMGRVYFSQQNPRGVRAEKMMREGVFTRGSVGFEPFEWQVRDSDGELITASRQPGEPLPPDAKGMRYTKWTVREFSGVATPADDDAMPRFIVETLGVRDLRAAQEKMRDIAALVDRVSGLEAALRKATDPERQTTAWEFFGPNGGRDG